MYSDCCVICTDFTACNSCIISIKLQYSSCGNTATTLFIIATCSYSQITAMHLAFAHGNACGLNQAITSTCVNSCARNGHIRTCNNLSCIHCATVQGYGIISLNTGCVNRAIVHQQLGCNYINLLGIDAAVIHSYISSCLRHNIACEGFNTAIVHGYSSIGCSHAYIAISSLKSTIIHGYIASCLHCHIFRSCNCTCVDCHILACNESNITSDCSNFAAIYENIIIGCSQGHASTTHACALSYVNICFLVGDLNTTLSLELIIDFNNILYTLGHVGNS